MWGRGAVPRYPRSRGPPVPFSFLRLGLGGGLPPPAPRAFRRVSSARAAGRPLRPALSDLIAFKDRGDAATVMTSSSRTPPFLPPSSPP